jgi:hypothetical protein
MRSLRYKRVPGTNNAIITETRKTDLPCHEIGRLVAASRSKLNGDRCVNVALPLLTCRFLGQSFGGSSSCPHPRLTYRHAKPGGRGSPRSARHRRAVGGAHPHINACGRTLANQELGAAPASQGRRMALGPRSALRQSAAGKRH